MAKAGVVISPSSDGLRDRSTFRHAVLADKRIRFLFMGSANALMAFMIFIVLQHLFSGRWGYLWAVLGTYAITVIIGFISHRRLVFRVRGHVWRDLRRFEVVHASNVALNAALLAIAVEALSLPVLLSQAIINVLSALVTWFGHSRYSFRRPTVVTGSG